MLKKCTFLLLAAALAMPAIAQQKCCKGGDVTSFSPKKGQWQVSLSFGGASNGYRDNNTFLLPSYTNTEGSIGLPNGGKDESGNLGYYLNLNGAEGNNVTKMAGLDAKYFVSDCWAINFGLSMNINLTPSKDYVEGEYEKVPEMIIPEQKYINAQMTNNWYVHAGFDRYFNSERFARIHPYLGAQVGFQMSRIETTSPYMGEVGYGDELDETTVDKRVYIACGKAGQMFGIRAAAVAGIEYSVAKGLILGFEFHPLSYRYDVIQLFPKGFDTYNASHHNIKIAEMPQLKLGFRF